MTVTIQHLTINFDGGAILLGGLLLLVFILLIKQVADSQFSTSPLLGFIIFTLTFVD